MLLIFAFCSTGFATDIQVYQGYFKGANGKYPLHWRAWGTKGGKTCGLTDEYGFKDSKLVMRLSAQPGKTTQLESLRDISTPRSGFLKFTVWARSVEGKGRFRMYALGDGYKWGKGKTFTADGKWRKFALNIQIPEMPSQRKDKFWIRLDAMNGSDLLFGRTDLSISAISKSSSAEKSFQNLIENPDFSFGFSDWFAFPAMAGFHLPFYPRRLELREGAAVVNPGGIHMISTCYPYIPGQKYSVTVKMKNAVPGKNSIVTVYILNGNWDRFSQRYKLTDQWKEYSFSGSLPKSAINYAYFRVSLEKGMKNPAMISRVQVKRGDDSRFEPLPPIRFGLVGRNIFDYGDKNASLNIRLLMNSPSDKAVLKYAVVDAFDQIVDAGNVELKNEKDQIAKLKIRQRRGVFRLRLSMNNHKKECRYAMLKNLEKADLPDNCWGMHQDPFVGNDLELHERYLPFSVNRFQWPNPKKFTQAELDRFWPIIQKRYKNCPQAAILPPLAPFLIGSTEKVTPKSLALFKTGVEQYTNQISGRCQIIELINEPMLWRIKKGIHAGTKSMPPERVAALYKAAYPLIKKINPKLLIAGPCIGFPYQNYLDRFLAAGGGKYIDIFSFHGYCDNPNNIDLVEWIKTTKEKLKKYTGKNIPLFNTEQYFGLRDPRLFHHPREWRTGYFHESELLTAKYYVDMLTKFSALQVWFCNFMQWQILRDFYGVKNVYPHFSSGSLNAAIEFLGTAGRGDAFFLDESISCLVFPKTKQKKALLVINTILDSKWEMECPMDSEVFDMFGNKVHCGTRLKLDSYLKYIYLPVGCDPYDYLKKAELVGSGKPFKLDFKVTSENTFCVEIKNRTRNRLPIKVSLEKYPERWIVRNREFSANVAPKQGTVFTWKMDKGAFRNFQANTLTFKIQTADEYETKTVKFAPLFADYSATLSTDHCPWYELGEKNLSCKISKTEFWRGNNDLSAKFACVWNQTGLLISVIVKDDKCLFPREFYTAHEYDSIQLYFDMKNDGTIESSGMKNNSDDIDYNVAWIDGKDPAAFITRAAGTRFIGENNLITGIDREVEVRCKRLTPNEIRYDIHFPKQTLYGVNFARNSVFGFSMLINDNDGKGRKTGLTLTPKGTEPYMKPYLYLDVILR